MAQQDPGQEPTFDPVTPRKHPVVTALTYLGKPVMMVCDPVAKLCFPVFQAHWEKKYRSRYPRHAGKLLLLDLFLLSVVGALSVAAIFIKFIVPALPQPGTVEVHVEDGGPVTSGEPYAFTLRYANGTADAVASASASVLLPPWFVTELPRDVGGAVEVPIGEIASGASGTIAIKGRAFGAVGDVLRARAELSYWKDADSSAGVARSHGDVVVATSVADVEPVDDGPIVRGRQTAVRFAVHNGGNAPRRGDILTISVPQDFVLLGSEPEPRQPGTWVIPDLAPGATFPMTLNGYYRTSVRAPGAFIAATWADDGNGRRLLDHATKDPQRLESGFELTQVALSPTNGAIAEGDELSLRIRYRNGGDSPAAHVRISLTTDSDVLAEKKTYVWDEGVLPALALVQPGVEGAIEVVVRAAARFPAGNGAAGITIAPIATLSLADAPGRTVFIEAEPLTFVLTTTLSVDARAAYFLGGDQVGRGPLPLRSGETTKFRVLLALSNGVNAAHDVIVEAQLAPGATWTGRSSVNAGSALSYVPASGRVRWTIDALTAFAGRGSEPVLATFEVAVTPDADGTLPMLVRDITVTGTDAATGSRVRGTADDIIVPAR
jgi:hypothetical protein